MLTKNKINYWNKKLGNMEFFFTNKDYWVGFILSNETDNAIFKLRKLIIQDAHLVYSTEERKEILDVFNNIKKYE